MFLWCKIHLVNACRWCIYRHPRRRLAVFFYLPKEVSQWVDYFQWCLDKKRLPRRVGGCMICGILRNLG